MRRSNTTALATANIADIPPDLVNPSAVELVLDIRREYGKKLEQVTSIAFSLHLCEYYLKEFSFQLTSSDVV